MCKGLAYIATHPVDQFDEVYNVLHPITVLRIAYDLLRHNTDQVPQPHAHASSGSALVPHPTDVLFTF